MELWINDNGIFGRTILSAIYDSIYTFKNGKPCESFANLHGTFQYENVMNSRPPPILSEDLEKSTKIIDKKIRNQHKISKELIEKNSKS